MPKHSKSWLYFTKDDSSEKAICNLCERKLCYKKNVTNLKSHLQRIHKVTFPPNRSSTDNTSSSPQLNPMMNNKLQKSMNINLSSAPQQPMDIPTYSNIAKSKSMVAVKPWDTDQVNSKTKLDIMRNMNVSQVDQINVGAIFIGCYVPDGAENFKKVAIEKLASNYNIPEDEEQLPKVRIVGLVENYSSEDILKSLKTQNKIFSEESHLRVLKTWATQKNKKIFQALIELDAVTYNLVMDRRKVFVNFDDCSVYDATGVICFRCSGFNHSQIKCSREVTCPKCAGEHILNDCSSSVYKCLNCTNANLTNNSHAAWDAVKCPIYKKKLNNSNFRL